MRVPPHDAVLRVAAPVIGAVSGRVTSCVSGLPGKEAMLPFLPFPFPR